MLAPYPSPHSSLCVRVCRRGPALASLEPNPGPAAPLLVPAPPRPPKPPAAAPKPPPAAAGIAPKPPAAAAGFANKPPPAAPKPPAAAAAAPKPPAAAAGIALNPPPASPKSPAAAAGLAPNPPTGFGANMLPGHGRFSQFLPPTSIDFSIPREGWRVCRPLPAFPDNACALLSSHPMKAKKATSLRLLCVVADLLRAWDRHQNSNPRRQPAWLHVRRAVWRRILQKSEPMRDEHRCEHLPSLHRCEMSICPLSSSPRCLPLITVVLALSALSSSPLG